jgi:hypothetical protein
LEEEELDDEEEDEDDESSMWVFQKLELGFEFFYANFFCGNVEKKNSKTDKNIYFCQL